MLEALLASTAFGALIKALAPLLEPLLNAVGKSINDYIDSQRADANAKDLGQTKAELDAAKTTIDAQQAELDALANAPQNVSDAIKRLGDGTA